MKTQYANAVTQYENGTSLGGRIIKEGGLVVFPTETVYGLGANGLNSEAVLKIFAAKGRPADNPLILHIAKKSELKPLWSHVPDNARILADTFWPGPLTMIFNRSSIVPDEVTAGLDTVAVRMPLNKTARALINAAGVPIAAPSANLSGKPSPTTAEHVRQDMDGRVDLIIDGGPCKYGLESTVVSLIGRPTILRPGAVTKEMLEARTDMPVIAISARQEQGVEILEEQIKSMFFAGELSFNDEVYITNVRHKTALEEAYQSLTMVEKSIAMEMPEDFFSIDLMNAYEALGRIVGESVGEDLVNEIFSKFCTGK